MSRFFRQFCCPGTSASPTMVCPVSMLTMKGSPDLGQIQPANPSAAVYWTSPVSNPYTEAMRLPASPSVCFEMEVLCGSRLIWNLGLSSLSPQVLGSQVHTTVCFSVWVLEQCATVPSACGQPEAPLPTPVTFSFGSRLMVFRGRSTRRTRRDLMVLMSFPLLLPLLGDVRVGEGERWRGSQAGEGPQPHVVPLAWTQVG